MSEEEMKAIEFIQKRQEFMKSEPRCVGDLENNIDTILKLIEKQQAEIKEIKNQDTQDWEEKCNLVYQELNQQLEKKDKVINEMAKEILRLDTEKSKFEYDHAKMWDIEKGIKEYFTRKVEKDYE